MTPFGARGQSIPAAPENKGPGSHLTSKFCNERDLRRGKQLTCPAPGERPASKSLPQAGLKRVSRRL